MFTLQKQSFKNEFEILPAIFPNSNDTTVFCDHKLTPLPITPYSSLHYHNRLEIGICRKGSGIIYNSLNGECIRDGDITIFFPGVSHYSHSFTKSEPCLCSFVFIDVVANLFSLFKENKSGINLLSVAQNYDIPYIIRKTEYPKAYSILYLLLTDVFDQQQNIDFLTSLHLAEFLTKVPLIFKAKKNNTHLTKKTESDVIYIAEAFISSHYNDENISTAKLCELCALSESQLRRRFKNTFGTSPFSYLHRLRCNIGAQLLLQTNLPIQIISQKIGYCDHSEFYKHFKNIFGCSPSSYRTKNVK